MIDRIALIELLNDLLARERGSVFAHLLSSTPFVSRATAEEDLALRRMVREHGEHVEWLTQEIVALKAGIGPARNDMRAAELNYQELHHVLPILIDSESKLVARYESALKHLDGYPTAAAALSRILARHREGVAQLASFLAARKAA